MKIDAGQLEVRDKDKVATFSGGVKVVQGDTTMRAKTLAVFYDGEGSTRMRLQRPSQDHLASSASSGWRRRAASRFARTNRLRPVIRAFSTCRPTP